MHPELIRALGRERQAELLRAQQFRDSQLHVRVDAEVGPASDIHRAGRPIEQFRRSLGSALVVAGTRLMATNRVSVD